MIRRIDMIITNRQHLLDIVREQRRPPFGYTIVFTNGCFDVLHAGHIYFLQQAKALGDVLIVAINSDESVKRIKGEGRPIMPWKVRAFTVDKLPYVDIVTYFGDDCFERDLPMQLIALLHPDYHVKGEDWEDKKIPERKTVELYGGCIEFIEHTHDLSTTKIINSVNKGGGQ
jgi:rfaE bifunctional protein nucleotidyltransferase chain/domain